MSTSVNAIEICANVLGSLNTRLEAVRVIPDLVISWTDEPIRRCADYDRWSPPSLGVGSLRTKSRQYLGQFGNPIRCNSRVGMNEAPQAEQAFQVDQASVRCLSAADVEKPKICQPLDFSQSSVGNARIAKGQSRNTLRCAQLSQSHVSGSRVTQI